MITSEKQQLNQQGWVIIPEGTIKRFRAVFVHDEDGGYTVFAANLPGVVSEGETVSEATANITEAFELAIETYKDLGRPIPWKKVQSECKACIIKLIPVNV